MMAMALVTGFLGSGKTTFLKNLVERGRNRRIVYVVNEFSPRDIDAELVSDDNTDVVSIPGGSIFCRCIVTEFINQMKEIARRWRDAEGVVVEASGMASPKVVAQMLSETGLDAHFRLASIISIVDPASFLKLRLTLPNIIAQIEAADIILLNKLDLCPESSRAGAESEIRRINPKAILAGTVRCDAPVELFAERSHAGLRGEYAKCVVGNFATFTSERGFTISELTALIGEFPDSVYRVKGWLGGEYVDYSLSGFSHAQCSSKRPDCLVWIVKGAVLDEIRKRLEI